MKADELRSTFLRFFADRGHLVLPAASLVPNDPTMLFTIAGMVQFKPYFLAESPPPGPRATTVQPCVRTIDIDLIGTTSRHVTFFEMLGNFSFGDYFKAEAVAYAWELFTEVLGLDPDRLWATVHVSDDEAEAIWHDATSLPDERIQRLDEDNFWKMGETGPCGPSSEIFFDRGPAFGPDGGPAVESDRYVELWNLVFMQYDRSATGELSPLPQRNIDTGAGLDRILTALQGVESVFDTDLVAPIVDVASSLTGKGYRSSEEADVGLRIVADHARTVSFLVADGVFPSNESRGYVLRRLIRRTVLVAQRLGAREPVMERLVEAVTAVMAAAYPRLARDRELITNIAVHEEEAFSRTLRSGTALLEEELARGADTVAGEVAFRLHDTFGFPIELTTEIASARGIAVDRTGFEAEMARQRARARDAGRGGPATAEDVAEAWSEIRASFGPTEFVGYHETATEARVLAVVESAVDPSFANVDGESAPDGTELVEVFLDRTPFYAEGGGQVGDTGTITTVTGRLRVLDTTAVVEGLTRHLGYVVDGVLEPGQEAAAAIDTERRDAIRRNHTGTHLLHWALRKVLGDHVRQQGSLVTADRLRFDFSHFGPVSRAELDQVEDAVNAEVLRNDPVVVLEASRAEAEQAGAIAFFGEKYGDVVRVVTAGRDSVELCGGTHVAALGTIGPLQIVAEASIGSNTRRIEAVTGTASLARLRTLDHTLDEAAGRLRTQPLEVVGALERVLERQRSLEDELKALRSGQLSDEAGELAAAGAGGRVVAQRDGLDANELRDLALAVRDRPGISAVALAGATGPDRVGIVVALGPESGLDARQVAAGAAKAVGGGGGGSPELATAGGRDTAGLDEAVATLRAAFGIG